MNSKLVIATGNKGKLVEFEKLLAAMDIEILSLADFPQIGDIAETGTTFAENALIKAREVTKKTGLVALADDSGLEVDFLNGQPGVNSARFAGEHKSDADNNNKLLQLLSGVPDEKRTARFKCVIAIVKPEGEEFTVEGSCEGIILHKAQGEGGFGYDPLFYLPDLDRTFAELSTDLKNEISHRGKALEKAINILREIFNNCHSLS